MDAEQLHLHAEHENSHWWFLGRRAILRRIVGELLSARRQGHIVDVGCGTGGNIGAFAGEYGAAGIDLSETAIALARERFPGVDFWSGPLTEAPAHFFEQADLVLLTDVLEHTPDDYLFLSTLLSRVRTGTAVVITVPANASLWSSHDVALEHYRRYTVDRLTRLWAGLPVDARLVSHYNSRLYWPIRTARGFSRLLGRGLGARGTDLRRPPALVNRLLSRLFAGEGVRLTRALTGQRGRGFANGVSIIAVLETTSDGIVPRHRPPDAAPDMHDPKAGDSA